MARKNIFKTIKCSDGTIKNFTIFADGYVSMDIHYADYSKYHIYLGKIKAAG